MFHITTSGLFCGIFVIVLIEMFHQYSYLVTLYTNSHSLLSSNVAPGFFLFIVLEIDALLLHHVVEVSK